MPTLPSADSQRPRRCAVIGAGWAGLAGAVRAVQAGWTVELFEMASTPGGRARTVSHHGHDRDNGQHILIGAYTRTLDLMRTVGVDEARVLARQPLAMVDGQGLGLRLPKGPAMPSFARAVLANANWSWRDKLALLTQALGWRMGGFSCAPQLSVEAWSASLPARIRQELIEPLCVAALNTTAREASASVLLRVLKDALFAGPGSADLLLPRAGLGQLLPQPALSWLKDQGAQIHLGHRVQHLARRDHGWSVDGAAFDHVILACSAQEAGRLSAATAPGWSAQALSFAYEPIVTIWLRAPAIRAPSPMVLLRGDPAQFGFDLGQLDPQAAGSMTLVVSGAAPWVERGRNALVDALNEQLSLQWRTVLPQGWDITEMAIEKRATFRCTPGLARPPAHIAPGLCAAGDFIEGPYPATLEGAVRSGENAVAALKGQTSG